MTRLPVAAPKLTASVPPQRRTATLVQGILSGIHTLAKHSLAAAAAVTLAASAAYCGPAALASSYSDAVAVRNTQRAPSHLPTRGEADALLKFDQTLFTDDAWKGMLRLREYGEYCTSLADVEEQPGCEQCAENRQVLEKAWQVVANDFFDATGAFSQADWAQQLLITLQESGGALHDKPELYTAAERMVSHLHDRYSTFLPPTQFRRALMRPSPAERNYYAAQYVGLGIQFGEVSPLGGRLVDAPLAGSPAEAAGIVRGDRILAIDGRPAADMTLKAISTRLRGPAGSSVSVQWAHAHPSSVPITAELERAALPQPPLKEARLPLRDGSSASYLRIHFFSSEATRLVTQAVQAGEHENVAGYVVDLRNDPGGVFEEAVAIASLFLPESSPIVGTVHSLDFVDNIWRAGQVASSSFGSLPRMLTSKPVVLLVNSSSASASEVLSGALHDNGRALLVGERTFGKGLVQYYYPMPDNSGLRLTVAKYLTPASWDITRRGGLAPDVLCTDYPHGVLAPGHADRCVLTGLDYIRDVARSSHQLGPSSPNNLPAPISPLLADAAPADMDGGDAPSR